MDAVKFPLRFSNIRWSADTNVPPVALPLGQLVDHIFGLTGGWPRRVGNRLFVLNPFPDGTPIVDETSIRVIGGPDDYHAWLMAVAQSVRFYAKECQDDVCGRPCDPVRLTDIYSHSLSRPEHWYMSVERLPHAPDVFGEDVYYLPTNLPKPTGKWLRAFIDHLNPKTDVDRELMKAAIITPMWSGPPGSRPIFSFKGEKGSGKTEFVHNVCRVYGGAVESNEKDDWDTIRKNIVNDKKLGRRCLLIDNLTVNQRNSGLAALVTATTLGGHVLYTGYEDPPNRLTIFLTCNKVQLDDDLVERSVIIDMGKPVEDPDRARKWRNFTRDLFGNHFPDLVADIVEALQREHRDKIKPGKATMDRFDVWQKDVLTCCENPDNLAREIELRRGRLRK